MTEEARVHHATKKAADISLAKKQISPDSHKAIYEGRLSLGAARELGRDRGPDDVSGGTSGPGSGQETSGTPKDTPPGRHCLCGCGRVPRGKKSRFVQGHDSILHGELKRNLEKDPLLRNERFDDEQRRYAVERGLAGPEALPKEERDG